MSVFTNSESRSIEQARAYTEAILGLLGTRDPIDVLEQVVQHLADSELVWGYRLRLVLAQDRPTLTGYDQDLWSDRLHYERLPVDEALDRLTVLRRSNLRLLADATAADLQRVGVHAERGEESVAHMIRLYAGHDLLHLRQLARIREAVEPNR